MEELLKKWKISEDQQLATERKIRKKSMIEGEEMASSINYLTFEENTEEDETFIKIQATSRVKKLIERLKKPETIDVH